MLNECFDVDIKISAICILHAMTWNSIVPFNICLQMPTFKTSTWHCLADKKLCKQQWYLKFQKDSPHYFKLNSQSILWALLPVGKFSLWPLCSKPKTPCARMREWVVELSVSLVEMISFGDKFKWNKKFNFLEGSSDKANKCPIGHSNSFEMHQNHYRNKCASLWISTWFKFNAIDVCQLNWKIVDSAKALKMVFWIWQGSPWTCKIWDFPKMDLKFTCHAHDVTTNQKKEFRIWDVFCLEPLEIKILSCTLQLIVQIATQPGTCNSVCNLWSKTNWCGNW